MTTNNGLIPEHRTDKNGRNVLRHVRPQQAVTESAVLAATAPSVAAPVPFEWFNDNFRSFWDSQDISDTHYSDEDFDQRAVIALNRIFSSDSEFDQPFGVISALARGFNEMIGVGEEEAGRTSIHNVAVFAEEIGELSGLRNSIDGLHITMGGEKDYLLDANDDERAVAVAVMRATAVLGERANNWEKVLTTNKGKYGYAVSITDKPLLDLVVEYAPRISDLLELIDDDADMPDAETLREMLAHEQKALAKGVL